MAPIPIRPFLSEFRTASRFAIADVEALLKSFKSEIKSLDELVTTLPVTKSKHGFIELADNTVGKVNRVLREGDLAELVRIAKRNVPFTSVEATAFRSLVSDTPEIALKSVTDLAETSARAHPHLNLREADFPSMSKTAAADIKTVENNLFKYVKQGTTLALTLGAVYVGVDWLTKTTAERKGCFMLTTINGTTTSCKVAGYSCIGSGGNTCATNPTLYNTTLILIKVASLPDTDELKIKVAAAAGIEPSAMNTSLATIIDTKYAEIDAVILAATTKPSFVVCGITNSGVENGIVPPCRMCSPSDNPISTTFIDPKQYADNVTFSCSINPSLLDTIADAAKKTGKDLLNGITGGLSAILKPLAIIAAIVVAIIIAISVVMRVMKSNKAKGLEAPSPQYKNNTSTA